MALNNPYFIFFQVLRDADTHPNGNNFIRKTEIRKFGLNNKHKLNSFVQNEIIANRKASIYFEIVYSHRYDIFEVGCP